MTERADKAMRETVRQWLIDAEVGLIDRSTLVQRIDRTIGDMDAPPHYLLQLSTGASVAYEPRVDLALEPQTHADLKSLAARLLAGFQAGELSSSRVAEIAFKTSLLGAAHADPVLATFARISDELHFIEVGAGATTDDFERFVVDALRRLSDGATG